jgi:hypothetical protein
MVAKCAGITRAGQRCSSPPVAGSDFCFLHDPARAAGRTPIAPSVNSSAPSFPATN